MMSGISGMDGMMGGMRPDPQPMFNRVDKDGSGGIDKDEWNVRAEKIAERTGNEIDGDSLMEAYDGDGDGVLNRDETHAAMQSLRETMGPPAPPQGGGMNRGAGGYGQNGAESETSIDQLLEALSDSEDAEAAKGVIQECLETLQGKNVSYNPVDIQA